MKNSVLAVLLMCFIQVSFGQKKKTQIHWNKDRALTWKDFKGRAKGSSPFHATTYGILKPGFEPITNTEYKFTLEVLFDSKKSWVKKGKETDELLIHEQHHFNMFEIYARIFVKRLEESNALSGKKFSDNMNKTFQKIFKELIKLQDKYDKETDHSKNEEKQKEWNIKLENMLKEYQGYAKREIIFEI